MKKPERELVRRQKKRIRVDKVSNKKSGSDGFATATKWFFGIGFLGLFGLMLAAFFTPMLAIENVKVVGTERLNAASVSAALEQLKGTPLTQLSDDRVAQLLEGFDLVETFAVQAEPPHALVVKIRERQPIVTIPKAGKNLLYDPAGVEVGIAQGGDKIPYLKISGGVADNPQFETAIEILLAMPVETYQQIFSMELSSKLTATMRLRESDIRVIWGDDSQAGLKSEVLQSLLANKQKPGVTIDVSSPTAPVVTHPDY